MVQLSKLCCFFFVCSPEGFDFSQICLYVLVVFCFILDRTHAHTHHRELSTRFQCECVSEIVLVEKEVDFIKICVFSSYIFHLF